MILLTLIFDIESIFDDFRTIGASKMAKNHFFDEKSQKSSLQPPPFAMIRRHLGPAIHLKILKIKVSTLIFHIESIFDDFRTIGTRKTG